MTDETLDTGIIARIHEAFNRRDLDAIAAELTDDVVFHQIPGIRGAPPTTQGRDAVLQGFEMMMRLGEQRIEDHNAESLAGFVVGVSTTTLTVGGTEQQMQLIDVCRLRDGKLAERWAMVDRPSEASAILANFAGQAAEA